MDVGFRKYIFDDSKNIINFDIYSVEVTTKDGQLVFVEDDIWGMMYLVRCQLH